MRGHWLGYIEWSFGVFASLLSFQREERPSFSVEKVALLVTVQNFEFCASFSSINRRSPAIFRPLVITLDNNKSNKHVRSSHLWLLLLQF